jgi:O-Antigen ligase
METTESAPPFATGSVGVSERGWRSALPALLLTAAVVVGLASSQGGYFPTSWGLSGTLLLWAIGLWLVLSARTDAGLLDLVYFGLLSAYTLWVGLSIAWSFVPAETVLELERTFLVLAGVTAVLVLARREHVPRLAGVLLAAITAVSSYALATRLFPDRLGTYDPIAGYRLSDPLGYWNSLGVFAAMGLLLAVGFVADSCARWARAAGAAALVPLAATLYYTYSRGSWIALGVACVALVALTPRRLRTIATVAVVAAPAVVGVIAASRPYALTHETASLAASTSAGHRVATALLLLAAAAAALAVLVDAIQRRVAVPRRIRLACGVALLAVALLAVGGAVAREGGPAQLASRGWHAFDTASPRGGPNLNRRLFSFSGSGRVDIWRGAKAEYVDHQLTGGGAGTFERFWEARRGARIKVRDAHSLYLETLAELGPPGLAFLLGALLVPVAAAFLVRRQTLMPAALGAYVAFLVHAGVDWDWELSGVVLTALLIGSLSLIAARAGEARVLGRNARVLGASCVVVASMAMIVAYLGNGALDRAQTAVADKSYPAAIQDANRARRLMPWSPWPLIARGDAQLAAGDAHDARASYRHAISIDSGEWRAWLGLALASRGHARATALAEARRLYPTSSEIAAAVAKVKDGTNG